MVILTIQKVPTIFGVLLPYLIAITSPTFTLPHFMEKELAIRHKTLLMLSLLAMAIQLKRVRYMTQTIHTRIVMHDLQNLSFSMVTYTMAQLFKHRMEEVMHLEV